MTRFAKNYGFTPGLLLNCREVCAVCFCGSVSAPQERMSGMSIQKVAERMKLASPLMAASKHELRIAALEEVRDTLQAQRERIFVANAEDLSAAKEAGVPQPVWKRLKFDEGKLHDVCAGIDQLISLPDPIGKVTLDRMLDEGLELKRVSVPIGVIGVIFEARPDALVQISSLCIKSGNCVILKGGRETQKTNRVLSELIAQALAQAGLPKDCFFQAQEREEVTELLSCDGAVDLIIPRGSNAFVRYIMDHTRIPVMGHAEGVCHLYIDASADQEMALKVVTDAKIQYPVACNAVETVLVQRKIAKQFLPILYQHLQEKQVQLHGNEEIRDIIPCLPLEEEGYRKEYLDLGLTLALVDDCAEAADHINRYGSHHTDGIIASDEETVAYFMRMVDSAGVYHNCSTRFADGFRYGFGAEVGIGTGKLHARGPVGLDGLVTYKYCLEGSGQTVGEYASGERSFHFRDLT